MPANDDLIYGWVSTDCGRGTSDILWSCLATILLCVWTVIHLPVPYYRGDSPGSLRQRVIRSGIGTALISVIAPEFLAITAAVELTTSWQGRKRMKRLTQMNWTLTHQFFLDMGGVCLESPSGRYVQIGMKDIKKVMESSPSDRKSTIHSDWIFGFEKLTIDQIEDLAKSDTLTKLIACGQALWLVTQVISRLCQHQAVTLLELTTCAYVSCALLSYAAWWKKPQACTSPIIITCSEEAISEIMSGNFESYYYETETWIEFVWAGRDWLEDLPDTNILGFEDLVDDLLFGLFPTFFGAIHVASWNTRLPSDVELWMWRASSIYCLISGVMFVVLAILDSRNLVSLVKGFLDLFFWAFATVYVIIRVFMIVEVFLSLRALPRSAFESVQWSSFVPHI